MSYRDSAIYSDDVIAANGSGEYIFAGRVGSGGLRRSLVRFDLANNIAPGSVITSVELTMYMSRTVSGNQTISLHYLNSDWAEGSSDPVGQEGGGTSAEDIDATWNYAFYNPANPPASTPWISPGGDYVANDSASTSVSAIGSYTWLSTIDMVADAQAWLDGPSSNFGWAVLGNELQGGTTKRFNSRSYPTVSQRPQLTITFTSPPNTGACCFSDGSCSVLSVTDCANASGTYQGNGTNCVSNPCPQAPSACCFNDGSCAVLSDFDCMAQNGTWQGPDVLCANADCPLILEKYADAMPVPPIAIPTTGTIGGTATYDIDIVQVDQQLHRDLPPTTVWTYDGVFPGPTIVARENFPVTVNFHNELRDEFGVYRTDHLLDVDLCPHGAEDLPKVVTHLHGGHVPAESDGYPDDAVLPGNSFTYTYPNINQESSLIWYHDHALGITRLNVYAGLAGGYIVRDSNEDSLALPTGEYEVPLIIQDRTLHTDGSLSYPNSLQESFFGEQMLVNGMVWPYSEVKRAKYRFRVLNGCNARTLTLSLSNGQSFDVISSEGGFLEAPLPRTTITLAAAERADLLIDFSALAPATEVFLTNSAPAPFPNGSPENDLPEVMKFVVTADTGPTPPTPPCSTTSRNSRKSTRCSRVISTSANSPTHSPSPGARPRSGSSTTAGGQTSPTGPSSARPRYGSSTTSPASCTRCTCTSFFSRCSTASPSTDPATRPASRHPPTQPSKGGKTPSGSVQTNASGSSAASRITPDYSPTTATSSTTKTTT